MDFVKIKTRSPKKGLIEIYPEFRSIKSKDLMIRGKSFYAIWDDTKGLWSTDEYDVQRLIDEEIWKVYNEYKLKSSDSVRALTMEEYSTGMWAMWKNYIQRLPDNSHQLDSKLLFSNDKVSKNDYASKRLPYPFVEGDYSAWDELLSTLYSEEERAKIEWAIGSIITGDSKSIQKFIVFYGEAGTGKSTIMNIIQQLFEGYYIAFEAKELTSNNNAFSAEVFKSNPLVAIQHDGNLSNIRDNSKLNSIVSHEDMVINEKYKSSYMSRINCFLFMGSNQPVKITDAKSGIIRRLIDVKPTGDKFPESKYDELMEKIPFQLSGIAYHCKEVYKSMGKGYYTKYRPIDMMFKTDPFFNFVEDAYPVFKREDGVQLKIAWEMYNNYCEMALIDKLKLYQFKEELKNYFSDFEPMYRVDGRQVRSYYHGFLYMKFSNSREEVESKPEESWLSFNDWREIGCTFNDMFKDCPAQIVLDNGKLQTTWKKCNTKLGDIDPEKVHHVKTQVLYPNLICIDFDIKVDGEKSFERNLEEASKFPPTYAELSKSGGGIHLYYLYDGDVNKLRALYSDSIEVKTFTGNASLRRRLSKCNSLPINTISSGLPLKEEKRMINFGAMRSERVLRARIERCLNKEYEGMQSTTQNVHYIRDMLDELYDKSALTYDIRDMMPRIRTFCNNSTNQASHCHSEFMKMHFVSKDIELKEKEGEIVIDDYFVHNEDVDNMVFTFFDIEVYPNLFLVCYKLAGDYEVVALVNPTPGELGAAIKDLNLIGYNNLRYDNHLVYGRLLGETNDDSFNRSQRIVGGDKEAYYRRSKCISVCDVFDYLPEKIGLKKWEIRLHIPHKEVPFRWDQPVDEKYWPEIIKYCKNDVLATEAVHNANQPAFTARKILAKLSGLTINDSTNAHTTRMIVGEDRNPQAKFVYTDLSEMFPGYEFNEFGIDKERYPKDERGKPIYKTGKSIYRGEDPSEGGYVYAEPGIYHNVALLDVASMHPTSIIQLNLFGPYTKKFAELYKARLDIKHKDYESAQKLFNGKLASYLNDPKQAKDLAFALKIAINSVYGLTSAKFENKLRDPRNIDNIVAKRGALFMIDLKHAVQEKGFTVAHIKTDSIKIPDATPEIIQFVMDFGKKYGYTFEHEDTYEKMCLVNDAVYIAKYKTPHTGDNGEEVWWTATGAQFQHPYVFKYLFSKEPIEFDDYCETKSVKSAIYLDFNEKLPEGEHKYQFVGKVGQFCPVVPGYGGGQLMREQGDKYYAVTGTTGYRWLESDDLRNMDNYDMIDRNYFSELVGKAIDAISEYGDFYEFASNIAKEKETEFIDIQSDELPF